MTEQSEAYKSACAAYVDEVSRDTRTPFWRNFGAKLTEMRAPEPATHADRRMHLTLGDMPKTEPEWPDGVKTNLLLEGRNSIQLDTDPDTKQRAMFLDALAEPSPETVEYIEELVKTDSRKLLLGLRLLPTWCPFCKKAHLGGDMCTGYYP